MTPKQFQQVEALFHRGKDLPPEEQRALLDVECGDDAEVRADVEKLLAQADPDKTLEELKGRVNRVLRPGADDRSAAVGGPAIEGYEIIREIHRGGQGVVYQAIQKSTKRKVAIKVLLEGPYASKSARRRFEREIELVAQLKHPNIVSIFHSGQTSNGRQYCVMDYVRGVPLDQYVRNEKLTLEDALRLFAKVCEAVNYAHQKGVIHRDLKPSNILVTPPLHTSPLHTPPFTKGGSGGGGDPKVLDFGLAKQLISREASLISLTGQVVGTLPYMSPEQAEGNPDKIDIRTDVYALGVILYQMLTGHYPYPVAGKMAEVLKHIAETEPTPPTRSWKSGSGVTQRAHKRIRPGQCPIDDEVQTIVLRTLSKERDRRYQSAGELAKDVAHYLADEPIDAKRDSAFYVIRKQLRRYKLPVAVAAAFVVVITVSLVVSVSLWRQAERDRAAAVLAEQDQSRARKEAEAARDGETKQRQEAVAARKLADERAESLRRFLYASTFSTAEDAYSRNDLKRMRRMLDECQADLRGWEWGYLSSLYDQSLLTIHGHTDTIRCLAVSPDGTRLVSGSDDHTIKLWDAATGENIMTLDGHDGWVMSITFSPDGKHIVSGSSDSTVKIWDAITGENLRTLHGHDDWVSCVAISPDGQRIVSGGWDAALIIWDMEPGEELRTLLGHEDRITSIAFSPDGKRIISASRDNAMKLWDARTGENTLTQRNHGSVVHAVGFTANDQWIVLGSSDDKLKVWGEAEGESVLALPADSGAYSSSSTPAISPDGKQIVSGGADKTLIVWDAVTGAELRKLHGHERSIRSVAFSVDGSQIISCDAGEAIKVWDAATGENPLTLPGHEGRVASVAFSPDGTRIVTGGYKTVKVWDVITGESILTLDGHDGVVHSVMFSPDGTQIVTTSRQPELPPFVARRSDSYTGSVRVWDAATGEQIVVLNGHEERVNSASFSPDETRIVTASHDKTARIWNAATGEQLVVLKGHEDGVESASFSPDGTRIVTASYDKTARIWDAATGNQLTVLSGHEEGVSSASFSPDGTRIVTASNSFSHYGTRLLTASWDNTVRIWDAASGSQLFVFLGHEDGVNSASFSPDGTRIVTASRDDTVRIWDAATGEQLIVFRGPEDRRNWVDSASFSPDGTRIVTRHQKTIRLWDSIPYSQQRYQQKQACKKAEPKAARLLNIVMATAPQRDGGPDLQAVAKSIRTDPAIDETVRHVAINLLMRRADQIRSKAEALKKESAEAQEDAAEAKNEATSQPPADAEESPTYPRKPAASQPATEQTEPADSKGN